MDDLINNIDAAAILNIIECHTANGRLIENQSKYECVESVVYWKTPPQKKDPVSKQASRRED